MAAQPELLASKEEPRALAVATPMSVLEMAVRQNASIEQLSQLLTLQERYEANEARKAFVVAMNAFKANPPQINKNKHVKFGSTEYDHATLDHVVETITQGLSRHGITHRWEVAQQDGKIAVTCVLTHELGHSERVTLEGPADSSGSKNAIQAIGSAVTYLQRYTLLSATGLAAKNGDNDGGAHMSDLNEKLEWIKNCHDLPELRKQFEAAYKQAKAIGDQRAMVALVGAKDARRKELEG